LRKKTLSVVNDCHHDSMNYVGVFIKGGDLNLAAIEREPMAEGFGSAVDDGFMRESFPTDSVDPTNLQELVQRIRQDLRDWACARVVLIETTKYAQWTYSQAHLRVLCIAALMLAVAEENIAYEVSKPLTVGAHLLSPQVDRMDPSILGFENAPKYWTTGAREAYAAAAFAARDIV
jgi:hypothetical protein